MLPPALQPGRARWAIHRWRNRTTWAGPGTRQYGLCSRASMWGCLHSHGFAGLAEEAGHSLKSVLQPPQSPDESDARGGLAHAEHVGRLSVVELLVVPQGEDLAIQRFHVVKGLLNPQLQFGPNEGLARRRELAQQLLGDAERARLRQSAAVEKHFPIGVAHS